MPTTDTGPAGTPADTKAGIPAALPKSTARATALAAGSRGDAGSTSAATGVAGVAGRIGAGAKSQGTVVRVMGIDPGSQRTGVGVVDVDAAGRAVHVHHDTLHLLDNESFALRLKQIFDQLGELIAQWQPQEIAIERVFAARNNADSVLKLGQARGAAICAVVHHGHGIHEYAAKEVKQAVVGRGAADKSQIQHMVGVLLGLSGRIQADAADALAIALTHAHTRSTLLQVGIARQSWRRRR